MQREHHELAGEALVILALGTSTTYNEDERMTVTACDEDERRR